MTFDSLMGRIVGGLTSDVEKTLTDQEKKIVQYHRQNVASGNIGRDEYGRPVTVWSTGIRVPRGKYKGKYVSVPGFVEGRQMFDERFLFDYWEDMIEEGYWPIYDDSDELNKRSVLIHGLME